MLWRLIVWIFGYRKPGKVSNVGVFDMAGTRTITWTLPPVSATQRPLASTKVSYRVKATPALPWTLQDTVAAPAHSLVINDPAPGTFEYQFQVLDADGTAGDPVVAEKGKAFDKPGQVSAVTIVDA